MVFGFDDVLEGFAIGDILYFIGEAIFGGEAISAGVESVSNFFFKLLDKEGIIAIQEIIDLVNGKSVPYGKIIDDYGGLIIKKIDTISTWENTPELNKIFISKEALNSRLVIIANQLMKNGVNILNKNGFNFFKSLIKNTIQIAIKGVKKSVNPEIIIPASLGVLGANKIYFSMKNKTKKEKSKLDILKELTEKEKEDDNEDFNDDEEIIGS